MAKQQNWNVDDRAGVAVLIEDGEPVQRLKRLDDGSWRRDVRRKNGEWQIGVGNHSSFEAGRAATSRS